MGLLIFDVLLHEKIGSLQDILRVKEKRRYRRQREKLQIKGGRKMRITTQMLANSAAKSGIPIQRTSLWTLSITSHPRTCWEPSGRA